VAVVGEGIGDWEWAVVGVTEKKAPGGNGPVDVRLGGTCERTGADDGDSYTLGLVDDGGSVILRLEGLGEGLLLCIGGLLLPTLPA
jgi:hypothetical protein